MIKVKTTMSSLLAVSLFGIAVLAQLALVGTLFASAATKASEWTAPLQLLHTARVKIEAGAIAAALAAVFDVGTALTILLAPLFCAKVCVSCLFLPLPPLDACVCPRHRACKSPSPSIRLRASPFRCALSACMACPECTT